ncbi:hypothetical protein D0T49_04250 [Paludibacter sp. 221]|uniref:hypothetical protein n=1 Tax=Paludibacter sp. 221 TaxID=2302939 RepID=UPI0013D3B432|nr:hypothetical protein [Paludibacter sp. 221]NDV46251.1 hypothetical protein [Paludibacter sp. 221]
MIFLDQTYFQGELYLPRLVWNSDTVGDGAEAMTEAQQENALWFIHKYEPEFMTKLLGKTLYQNFLNGLKQTTVNPIWEELKSELFKQSGKYRYSPCANYVFVFITRRNTSQSTQKGEIRLKGTYSQDVSSSELQIKVWGDMLEGVKEFYRFLLNNWDAYKGYADSNFCPHNFGVLWYF